MSLLDYRPCDCACGCKLPTHNIGACILCIDGNHAKTKGGD